MGFSYLIILYKQCINILRSCKYSFSSFMCELLTFVMFLLFGIPYLLVVACIQMYFYILDLFIGNQKYKIEVEQSESNGYKDMSKEIFKMMCELICDHDDEEIEVKDIVTKIKDKLNIDTHIRNQLFCNDISYIRNKANLISNKVAKTPVRTEFGTHRLVEHQYYNGSLNGSQDYEQQSDDISNDSYIDPEVALKEYNAVKRFLCENSISLTRYVRITEEPMSPISPTRVQNDAWNEPRHASSKFI